MRDASRADALDASWDSVFESVYEAYSLAFAPNITKAADNSDLQAKRS
jgi:hypothetical protein